MTFADGVLRLVRIGARIDSVDVESLGLSADSLDQAASTATESPSAGSLASPLAELAEALGQAVWTEDEESAASVLEHARTQPGLDDLEAAVALVQAGLASRVVLAGFPSWPGLLWRAYRLAEAADVLILPTVVGPGGRVDIVIARGAPPDG